MRQQLISRFGCATMIQACDRGSLYINGAQHTASLKGKRIIKGFGLASAFFRDVTRRPRLLFVFHHESPIARDTRIICTRKQVSFSVFKVYFLIWITKSAIVEIR